MAAPSPPLGELLPIDGIALGAAAAGVKYRNRLDVAVITLAETSVVGGVFTRNAFRAAPVTVSIDHMEGARALVVNSGNANAATGERGLDDARASCALVADQLGVEANQVLPFSTGVIGEYLNMAAMRSGIEAAAANARPEGWMDAARAIMTTDTTPKAASAQATVSGGAVRATGIAKGAGMIRPDMATMLAFLGTDAALAQPVAARLTRELADRSFNRITVDGDTSTNDSFVVMATGRADHARIDDPASPAYAELLQALTPLAAELAQRIVRDGEGATKFVAVRVEQGKDEGECRQVAFSIARSPLVKTALFAGDPNWGRFCMAIGNADVAALDPARVSLWLDDVPVAQDGLPALGYREEDAAAAMAKDEFSVRVRLGRGDAAATVWTTDLSYDYVRINAEYRS